MKKTLAILLTLVLLLGVVGCATETTVEEPDVTPEATPVATDGGEESTEGVSGTFTGTASGMQGPVTVEMTVENGAITNVTVIESSETAGVADVALERIPAQIVEHQTTTLDTVTGATLASRAVMAAAEAAAEEAGLDMDALDANAYSAEAGDPETWDTDVLVIGGGGAGFSAAITAAQEGSNVILIEKSSFLGGNTMMAGGAFNAVDPEAQAGMILTQAQKDTLDGYLALDPADPALKFDVFPEWEEVLVQLKADINAFYAENQGKTAGVDMPGFDSVALHMWHIYTGGLRELNDGRWIASDIDLARTLAESALGTFEWMATIGVDANYGANAAGSLYTVLGAMWSRTHAFTASTALVEVLETAANNAGVTIYTETAGTGLLVDETGKVVGAKAEKADGTQITINTAQGVVMASGGYCANPAMVKEYDQYWGDDLSDHTLSTNVGTNTGDGIIMAQAIGADVTGMEVAQMMPSSSPIKGTMTDGIWGDASEQLWIDGNGDRFVNEYAERDVLAKASLALDNGIFYIVYAGGTYGENGMLQGVEADNPRIVSMVEGGHIWYGETLAELAEKSATMAGGAAPAFTEEKLRETIELYNSYVAAQHDDDFGKENLAGAIDLEYIEATDGVGICISPRKSSLHHTMGGVVIDTEARVLDTEGNVIEGLWAAGEVTGGIHAGNRLGGNALADIFTFGRIAGLNASAAE